MIVRERICRGFIGRWMSQRKWGAVTLPWLSGALILFWVTRDSRVAEHEYSIHVEQIREMGGWKYLHTYVRLWLQGYRIGRAVGKLGRRESMRFAYDCHPMEQEQWRDLLSF